MNEFEKLYGDEFFIIDSNYLNNVSSRLYGFAIVDGNIIFNHNNFNQEKIDGTGSYIFVSRDDDNIQIFQDFNGSYGLFIYQSIDKNYFVISNSFLKLVEYLRDKVQLSFNQDYAKSYLTSELCSISYQQTLINEINIIPHFYSINLDILNKKLSFTKIHYDEKTIPITSDEYLDILDQWFFKWVSIINNIYDNSENIKLDISGGFDSRVVLTLMLFSGIDLNNIEIISYANTNNETFDEDYEIASAIAKDFNINLNNSKFNVPKYYFSELKTSINLSYYSKLGFSKQMYWNDGKYVEKIFHIRGYGGELIRQIYKNPSIESHILSQKNRSSNYSTECGEATKNILEYNFNEFKLISNEGHVSDYLNLQYRCTRNRYHYGKATVEGYLSNNIFLNPLIDPLLNKLKTNNDNHDYYNFLPSLIFLRYCPKLLEYKFEGGRKLDSQTVKYAKMINDKRPFIFEPEINKNTFITYNNKMHETMFIKKHINYNEQYDFLKNIFDSDEFKHLFTFYFSEDLYDKLCYNEDKLKPDDPDSDLNAIMGILKILEDVHYNSLKFNESIFDWAYNLSKNSIKCIHNEESPNSSIVSFLLNKFNTARIDIKNSGGSDNDIEVLDISDSDCVQLKPLWFSDSTGIGLQLESIKNLLTVKFKCINDGKLFIYLKSKDFRDFEGKMLPIYINYKKFMINGENILDNEKIASLKKPILYSTNVKNNEIYEISIEWQPY